jgi:hypothetical protein
MQTHAEPCENHLNHPAQCQLECAGLPNSNNSARAFLSVFVEAVVQFVLVQFLNFVRSHQIIIVGNLYTDKNYKEIQVYNQFCCKSTVDDS